MTTRTKSTTTTTEPTTTTTTVSSVNLKALKLTTIQSDTINFFKNRLHNKLEALRLYLSNVYANVPVIDDLKNVKSIIQFYKDVLLSYDLINILTLIKQNSADPIKETTDEIIYYVVFLVSIFVSLGMIENVDTVYNATYTTTREQFIKGLESFTLTGTTVGENIEKVLIDFLDYKMGNTKAENRIYGTKTMAFSDIFGIIRDKIILVINELQKLCGYKYTIQTMNQTCNVWQIFSLIVEIMGRVEYAMITSISNTTNTLSSDDDIITRAINENQRLINLANEVIGIVLTSEKLTYIEQNRDITSYMNAMTALGELYNTLTSSSSSSNLTTEQQNQLYRINNELMPLIQELADLDGPNGLNGSILKN